MEPEFETSMLKAGTVEWRLQFGAVLIGFGIVEGREAGGPQLEPQVEKPKCRIMSVGNAQEVPYKRYLTSYTLRYNT